MAIAADVEIGEGTKIHHPDLVNLYGCKIGKNCNIGAFVEIGKGVVIGDGCRIGAHSFIPEGVTIEDNVFIGPAVVFCNDYYPPSFGKHWGHTVVKQGASIGANCTICPGVVIGNGMMIGAGAVVTKSINNHVDCLAYGHPARPKGSSPMAILDLCKFNQVIRTCEYTCEGTCPYYPTLNPV